MNNYNGGPPAVPDLPPNAGYNGNPDPGECECLGGCDCAYWDAVREERRREEADEAWWDELRGRRAELRALEAACTPFRGV